MSENVHTVVRDRYAEVAKSQSCCGGSSSEGSSCCGQAAGESQSTDWGYTIDELRALPEGADLALGCGNPTALASLEAGQTVVDLGSGGGIDCFLAAKRVGPSGRVIGVDMTPEMLERARQNAAKAGAENVEFRLGEIEHLPIADDSVDVVISNCVINPSPDKDQVFAEAFRVLKSGGKLMVSDLVVSEPLPAPMQQNLVLLAGCIAGAMVEADYLEAARGAGFADVRVIHASEYLKHDHLEGLAKQAGISTADAKFIAEHLRSVAVTGLKADG